MALLGTCVVPHPPLILPAIGRGEEQKIGAAIAASEEAAKEMIVSKPRNTNKDHKKERIIEKLPKNDCRK